MISTAIDPRFRPLPLWAWNGDITEALISQSLQAFAAQGFGGAFIHPRPGLVTEYLGERWFDLWRHAQAEARMLGLQVHVYDENSYPSGFAGGHVLEQRPDLALKRLVCVPASEPATGERLHTFEFDGSQVAIELQPCDRTGWYAGKTYVDLLNPESVQTFSDLTHRRYAAELDVDGLLAFMDEPSLMDYSTGALPWSQHIRTTFLKLNGYDVFPLLPDLFVDSERAAKTRYDFQETLLQLFDQSFLAPLQATCHQLGLKLTGHLHEHEWPAPRYHPNSAAAYQRFDVPGIDLLGFQFDSTGPDQNGRWLLTILEAVSVADQLGKDSVLCEAYGGGGYQTGLADFKKLGDFLLANGINLIVPHMAYATTAGARKYDWPQTFSPHAPFWPDCELLQTHQARVASVLAQGKSQARILLLNPVASGWLLWTPDSAACKRDHELSQEVLRLRESFTQVVRDYAAQYLEFHLGDEWIMESHARVEGSQLVVGCHAYDEVHLPACMLTIRRVTLDLLEQFARAGGCVKVLGDGPERIDGAPNNSARKRLGALPQLEGKGTSMLRNSRGEPAEPGLCVLHRSRNGDSVWFLSNPWNRRYDEMVALPCTSVMEIDTQTGEGSQGPSTFRLTLNPGEHKLLLACPGTALPVAAPSTECGLKLVRVQRREPNVLLLDRCELIVDDRTFPDRPTIKQNANLWEAQGLHHDPWEWAVQFRQEIVDRDLSHAKPFEVVYRFTSEIQTDITLAVERAWLYRVELNGEVVSFGPVPFFDPETRCSQSVRCRAGHNTIKLAAEQFDIHCEIAPLLVMGNFGVREAALAAPIPLDLGDWSSYGLPFFPWTVAYVFEASLPAPSNAILVPTGPLGSSAEVLVDGELRARWWDGKTQISLGRFEAGTHAIEFRLRGSLRNLFGPFYSNGLPGPWSWYEEPESRTELPERIHLACGLSEMKLLIESG